MLQAQKDLATKLIAPTVREMCQIIASVIERNGNIKTSGEKINIPIANTRFPKIPLISSDFKGLSVKAMCVVNSIEETESRL